MNQISTRFAQGTDLGILRSWVLVLQSGFHFVHVHVNACFTYYVTQDHATCNPNVYFVELGRVVPLDTFANRAEYAAGAL